MLRVAVPNKGALSEAASAMLAEAGYRQRRDSRELVMADPENNVEFFFLRPRDIAIYVGAGTLDVGITGRDLLMDAQVDAEELLAAGLRRAPPSASPARPATSARPPNLRACAWPPATPACCANSWHELGIKAKLVRLDGAVESAVRLGVADAIADVV